MKIQKPVLGLLLFLMFGIAFVYCWRQSRSVEFYPILQKRCLVPIVYDKSLSGQLVLIPQDTIGYQFLTDMFSTGNVFYNLKTGEITSVDEQNVTGNFASSPDGKQLAYEEVNVENRQEKRDLVIRSYQGSETIIEMEAEQSLVYWLNNHKVVLWKRNPDKLPEVTILNLSTAKSQRLTPEYPDVISDEKYWLWANIWPVVGYYSPDMTRVLYPAKLDNRRDDSFGYADLILYDNKHHEQILRIEQIYKMDAVKWKQDGSGFFLLLNNYVEENDEGNGEIWLVDKNGVVEWKITMTEFFSTPTIHNSSLSPDNRYLSFSVNIWSRAVLYNEYWLFLDTANGNMFDFCLESDYPTVWSPDSKYIALASGNSNDQITTIIIDVNNRTAYEIADGYIPVGWLK